jgi:hypothetical protein
MKESFEAIGFYVSVTNAENIDTVRLFPHSPLQFLGNQTVQDMDYLTIKTPKQNVAI